MRNLLVGSRAESVLGWLNWNLITFWIQFVFLKLQNVGYAQLITAACILINRFKCFMCVCVCRREPAHVCSTLFVYSECAERSSEWLRWGFVWKIWGSEVCRLIGLLLTGGQTGDRRCVRIMRKGCIHWLRVWVLVAVIAVIKPLYVGYIMLITYMGYALLPIGRNFFFVYEHLSKFAYWPE